MLVIKKRRIRNPARYLAGIDPGTEVVIGVQDLAARSTQLARAGFSVPAVIGERILPAKIGPVTRRNAEGHYIRHRHLPKETVYRQLEWTRKEWHGRYQTEVTNTVDVPYQRYPRTFVAPEAVELSVAIAADNTAMVVAPPLLWEPSAPAPMTHQINLVLELFGEAFVLDAQLTPIPLPTLRRLNWELLPPGAHPWPRVQATANDNLARLPARKRPIAERRLKTLTDLAPDEIATGMGGFAGYWAFEFRDAGIVVLESLEYGNATYVLGADWKHVSALSKAEILNADLHKHRIVHMEGWDERLRKVVISPPPARDAA